MPPVLGALRVCRERLIGDGPAWSLAAYLAFALSLRLPAVLFADGFSFVDQQFQYVDPAWHLATGEAWHQPWEYHRGARSWVYPKFLSEVFRALSWFSLHDPMWSMRVVRALHAVASLLPLAMFWMAIVRWHALPSPRVALTLVAGAGLLVSFGVQPSGPTLAATLAVTAALAVQGPRWYPLFAGLCLGFAFCCRFQESLFGPGLLGVLVWQRRFRGAFLFAAGCLPGIAIQACVDRATYGEYFASVWNYFETNVLQGSASKWAVRPWWYYLAAGVVPAALFVPPWGRIAWRRFAAGSRLLPGASVAALTHIAAHSFIARKSLRFEQAAFAMLLAVVAIGIVAARGTVRGVLADWHRRLLFLVHGALLVHASFWFGNAGAVRTALTIAADPARDLPIVVVDGDATALGGFYYMRPAADRVVGVPRRDLTAQLQQIAAPDGCLVVAIRDPLDDALLRERRFAAVGVFTGMFDLSRGDRRFVYRWRG